MNRFQLLVENQYKEQHIYDPTHDLQQEKINHHNKLDMIEQGALHEIHHDLVQNGFKYKSGTYTKLLPHAHIEVFPHEDYFKTTGHSGESKLHPMSSYTTVADIEKKALLSHGTPEQIVSDLYNKHNSKSIQKNLISSAIERSGNADSMTNVLSKIVHDDSLLGHTLSEINGKNSLLHESDFEKLRSIVGQKKHIGLTHDYNYSQLIDRIEATSPNTSSTRLSQLSTSMPLDVLKHPNTSSDTIDRIHHINPLYAAMHRNISGNTLHKILDNSNTTETVLSTILQRNDITDEHKKKAISIPGSKGVMAARMLISNGNTSNNVLHHIVKTHAVLSKDATKHPNWNNEPNTQPEPQLSISALFNKKYNT